MTRRHDDATMNSQAQPLQQQAPVALQVSDRPLLDVRNLAVHFRARHGELAAVREVSFSLHAGRTLALLGESGSGKSVTAMSLMGLLSAENTRVSGSVNFDGVDLLGLPKSGWRKYRGHRISMVFQDALTALNPVRSVGSQIAEVIRLHTDDSRSVARRRALDMMDRVKIPAAAGRYKDFPHQFSGGMRQRIMIAMALALDPEILIADEPTTALDVTVQAQIVRLLTELQAEKNMSVLLITHNLGLAAQMADEIAVMYAGRLVEHGAAADVYQRARHPYTAGLLRSTPGAARNGLRLEPIQGSPPMLTALPTGCAFNPRCGNAGSMCQTTDPELQTIDDEHLERERRVACHFPMGVLR